MNTQRILMVGIEVGRLVGAWPRQTVTPDTVETFVRELADLPIDHLSNAVTKLIRTSEWFPTIAAIRAETAESILHLPSETDALSQIDARIAWARQGGDVGCLPYVHPLVSKAMEMAGGWHLFRSSTAHHLAVKQFSETYRALRLKEVVQVQSTSVMWLSASRQLGEIGS